MPPIPDLCIRSPLRVSDEICTWWSRINILKVWVSFCTVEHASRARGGGFMPCLYSSVLISRMIPSIRMPWSFSASLWASSLCAGWGLPMLAWTCLEITRRRSLGARPSSFEHDRLLRQLCSSCCFRIMGASLWAIRSSEPVCSTNLIS